MSYSSIRSSRCVSVNTRISKSSAKSLRKSILYFKLRILRLQREIVLSKMKFCKLEELGPLGFQISFDVVYHKHRCQYEKKKYCNSFGDREVQQKGTSNADQSKIYLCMDKQKSLLVYLISSYEHEIIQQPPCMHLDCYLFW